MISSVLTTVCPAQWECCFRLFLHPISSTEVCHLTQPGQAWPGHQHCPHHHQCYLHHPWSWASLGNQGPPTAEIWGLWSGHNTVFISHYPTNEMIQSEKAVDVRKTNWNHSHQRIIIISDATQRSFLCCFVSSICMSFRDLLLWIIYGKIVTSVICAGKKWHDKWFDIKGCIDTQWTKDFFNWITNILILCYPSKQALTLSISSVKLTIDRSVRVLLSPVDVSLLLEISWNSWKYWASATPHIWALCPCLPWQCDTEAGEYLIDFLNTELYASDTVWLGDIYINVFRHVNGQFGGVKWKDFIKIWMEIKMRMARWQFCFSNVKSFVTNIATFLNICHIHCHNVKM